VDLGIIKMNQIIAVPEWNPDGIKYLQKVSLYKLGEQVPYEVYDEPVFLYPSYAYYTKKCDGMGAKGIDAKIARDHKETKYKWTKFYSGFIYKTPSTIKMGGRDPLSFTFEAIKKYPNMKWKKFITKAKEVKIIKLIKIIEERIEIELEYLIIRPSIVSYLSHTLGEKCKAILELTPLFNPSNNLDFEEYLKKKTKQLSDLDLYTYLEGLRLEQEKKRKNYLIKINIQEKTLRK